MIFRGVFTFALALGAMASGQSAAPATRPTTAGRIAPAIGDVVPIAAGAAVPAVTLRASDGAPVDLRASTSGRPTVLIFYRGGWCQACARRLRGIEGVLPELADAGYQVIAVSPDRPDRARATADELGLTYPLLCDADAAAMTAFGLAYTGASVQFRTLERASGAIHHALPVPAIYLVGADGTIRFARVDPDDANTIGYGELLEQARAAASR